MTKSIAEINERIAKGQAVVVNAEEVIDLVKKKGVARAAREVDVVTTGTFGPMCSSGAYFNLGHSQPRRRPGLPQRCPCLYRHRGRGYLPRRYRAAR